MNAHYVLTVSGVDPACEEWLAVEAFEAGALGIVEALAFSQPEGEEDVFTREAGTRAVDVYFAAAPPPRFRHRLHALFPAVASAGRDEEGRDWLAEWKKDYKPFSLTGEHWVVPTWCEPPAAARRPIWIDPGMAFGTGTHETTRLMAGALAELGCRGKGVLDVGTGTGILAVLAHRLGAARVAATEIEADSRRVAHETFSLNGCAATELDERQVGDLVGRFDLVLANIIDGVLVRIQDDLVARVGPGGWLVLSGIIAEREPDFLEGMKIKAWPIRRALGDWRLFAARLAGA